MLTSAWPRLMTTLAADLDQAGHLPAAEDAADRVEGGACHLGQVLTGKREVDQNPVFRLPARLAGQPQHPRATRRSTRSVASSR